MKIINFFDEFLNDNYNRDFRIFGKRTKLNHAPKYESTNENHKKASRMFIKANINTKTAKYNKFFGGLAYYDNIIDYQLKNEDAKQFNHLFFDFDKHNGKFEKIKDNQSDAKEKLHGKEYYLRMNELQEQIQDMILFENLLNDAWQESKMVNEYLQKQGLKTFCCLSSSKGVHIRCFFKPIHVNNYNRIVSDLYHNLTNQFNLKTLDFEVSDKNPSKSVERLPYTFNEKSGLRVTPFSFETDSLNDVIDKAFNLSEKRRLANVDAFNLSDYVNVDFHNGLLKLDSQIDVLVAKEQAAKEKLMQEKIANGTINGNYDANGISVKDDLRILVKFVCGDENLVSEHELYDKYHCVFHNDRNPSAIVGKKNYQCLSSNCHINKLNYYGFIKEWFHLKSDQEIKEKIVEIQQLYDEKFNNSRSLGGEDVERIMNKMEQEVDA